MSDKPIIQTIFNEWWHKGSIVAASGQHKADVEQAFYCGWYAAMGMVGKAQGLPHATAKAMAQDMIAECRAKLMPNTVKFTTSAGVDPGKN